VGRELLIYADESRSRAEKFSNFYGGMLVESSHLEEVEERLRSAKREHGFDRSHLEGGDSEIKWEKVTEHYLDRYIGFVDELFRLMAESKLRTRVMFTQNAFYGTERVQDAYESLYYEFIRTAFGLGHCNPSGHPTGLRIYLDELPVHGAKASALKQRLHSLEQEPDFRRAQIYVPVRTVAEVRSHEHLLMQAVDVLLGAMQWRLNQQHLRLSPETNRRGRRTVAKDLLFRHVLKAVQRLHPGFNISLTTGTQGDPANRWRAPYRHLKFAPVPGTERANKKDPAPR